MTLTTAVRRPQRLRVAHAVAAGTLAAWVALLSGAGVHGGAAAGMRMPVEPWSVGWVATWLLMVAAMMWPLSVPVLEAVQRSSYPSWRSRLVLAGLATTTLLWLALGLLAAGVAAALGVAHGNATWQVGWLLVALVATRSAWRARVLWTCLRLPPLAPGGARGLRTAAAAGWVSWRRCALLCGPMMVAMAAGHGLVLLACTSATAWWEAVHPRRWHDPVPVALLAAAVAWVVVTGVRGG